jgi:glycerol-3-phosphate dehydrogenase (NAD(P)+)
MARIRRNEKYLPDIQLPDSLQVASEMDAVLEGSEAVVVAVASSGLEATAAALSRQAAPSDPLWICATKGLQPDGRRASEVLAGLLGSGWGSGCVLAGPSLAREVLRGLPTAVVAASADPELAQRAQELFHSEAFRVYTSSDVIGVELGVSLKNVLAIAAGLAQELGIGYNAYGALLTRGLAEMSRLGAALGARRETFLGLAGLGDLVTTCASPLSRNHQVGRRLARGEPLERILETLGSVAEGVGTARSALGLGQRVGVDLPITEQVHAILFEGKDPERALRDLLARPPRSEEEG